MQVDQARRHDLAGRVEHAQSLVARNVGFKRLDQPEADADVALGPQRLARIDHFAALDDEIELVVRPHRGARGAGQHQGGSARTGQKITTRKATHSFLPSFS
jgi:hypothetical protein